MPKSPERPTAAQALSSIGIHTTEMVTVQRPQEIQPVGNNSDKLAPQSHIPGLAESLSFLDKVAVQPFAILFATTSTHEQAGTSKRTPKPSYKSETELYKESLDPRTQ